MTLCREHILGLSAKLSFAESWLSANLSFAERWLSAKKFFFKPPQPHNLFYFFKKKFFAESCSRQRSVWDDRYGRVAVTAVIFCRELGFAESFYFALGKEFAERGSRQINLCRETFCRPLFAESSSRQMICRE